MDFYKDISLYYDYIFPFKKTTYNFLLSSIKTDDSNDLRNAKVLDIACGSGSYSLELGKKVSLVVGTDLDPLMIQQAKNKNKLENVSFKVHNMLDIEKLNIDETKLNIDETKMKSEEESQLFLENFDMIFCIGNSIAHLDTILDIEKVIKGAWNHLNNHGCFIVQIINFNRVLSHNIKSLPTIVDNDEGIEFVRLYSYDKGKHKIIFKTILTIESERIDEIYEQSVELYPIQVEELVSLFEKVGFKNIELFGSFSCEEFDKLTSIPLILRSYKEV